MIELTGKPSNRIKLIDNDGDSMSSKEGSVAILHVQDNNSEDILLDILKELRKLNLHMSLMTDVIIKDTEVE